MHLYDLTVVVNTLSLISMIPLTVREGVADLHCREIVGNEPFSNLLRPRQRSPPQPLWSTKSTIYPLKLSRKDNAAAACVQMFSRTMSVTNIVSGCEHLLLRSMEGAFRVVSLHVRVIRPTELLSCYSQLLQPIRL